MTQSLLQVFAIKKSFGGVEALKGVDFELEAYQVHALLGENGAGKSTLIKVLSGAYSPDRGIIKIRGQDVRMLSPGQARTLGIATIYQETSLYPDLSVLENLFMGRQPRTRLGFIDWRRMRNEADEIFRQLGVRVPLKARLGDLGKAMAQLVEIAKALSQRAQILIMDEPTAALSAGEVERLFKIIETLRSQGTAIVYISHQIEEIFRIADKVTVLRDGAVVGSQQVDKVDREWVIHNMVGRSLDQLHTRHFRETGNAVLQVEGLTKTGVFENVSLTLHEGEILGLAGLVGSGRSDFVRAIFGIDDYDSGIISINGKNLYPSPWMSLASGVGLVPEDRTRQGLILELSAKTNLALAAIRKLSRMGIVNKQLEDRLARSMMKDVNIRPLLPDLPASNFSGGNQQKLVLGKWLAVKPKILLMDEPTQGVDVGAKAEVHRIMDELVGQGFGILLVSSDIPEIIGMADRILVMFGGRIVKELEHGCDATAVLNAASGLSSETENVH